MHIDISQIKEWADTAKTAVEVITAIVTGVKAVTAIIRKRRPHARKARARLRTSAAADRNDDGRSMPPAVLLPTPQTGLPARMRTPTSTRRHVRHGRNSKGPPA